MGCRLMLIGRTNYAVASDVESDPLWREHGAHAKDPSRISLVDAPGIGRAARFELRPGDNNVTGSGTGERCEVMTSQFNAREGDVRALARKLDLSGYRAGPGGWNVIDQWHDEGGGTQSPIHFWCEQNNQLYLRLWGGALNSNGSAGTIRKDLGPVTLPTDGPFDFAYEIGFSADPAKGRAVVWIDGKQVWDEATATIITGRSVYYKQGIYRAPYGQTSVLVSGDTACFTSLAEALAFLGTVPPEDESFELAEIMELARAEILFLRQLPKPLTWPQIKASPVGKFYYGHGGK